MKKKIRTWCKLDSTTKLQTPQCNRLNYLPQIFWQLPREQWGQELSASYFLQLCCMEQQVHRFQFSPCYWKTLARTNNPKCFHVLAQFSCPVNWKREVCIHIFHNSQGGLNPLFKRWFSFSSKSFFLDNLKKSAFFNISFWNIVAAASLRFSRSKTIFSWKLTLLKGSWLELYRKIPNISPPNMNPPKNNVKFF